MMAELTNKLPEGADWTYEVKWDGYRALLLKEHGHVQLRSRNDNNLTATYPTIHAAALKIKAETALLDGEIVALDPKGKPTFQARGGQHPTPAASRRTGLFSATLPSCESPFVRVEAATGLRCAECLPKQGRLGGVTSSLH
jgi:hypothetical protein